MDINCYVPKNKQLNVPLKNGGKTSVATLKRQKGFVSWENLVCLRSKGFKTQKNNKLISALRMFFSGDFNGEITGEWDKVWL